MVLIYWNSSEKQTRTNDLSMRIKLCATALRSTSQLSFCRKNCTTIPQATYSACAVRTRLATSYRMCFCFQRKIIRRTIAKSRETHMAVKTDKTNESFEMKRKRKKSKSQTDIIIYNVFMHISFILNSCIIICRKIRSVLCLRLRFVCVWVLLLYRNPFSCKNRCQWVKCFVSAPPVADSVLSRSVCVCLFTWMWQCVCAKRKITATKTQTPYKRRNKNTINMKTEKEKNKRTKIQTKSFTSLSRCPRSHIFDAFLAYVTDSISTLWTRTSDWLVSKQQETRKLDRETKKRTLYE